MSPTFHYVMMVLCIIAAGFWLGVGIVMKLSLAIGIGLVFTGLAVANLFFSGDGNE